VPTVRVALALVRQGDELLLEKRDAGLLAGTWGLPWVEGGAAELRARVEALSGGAASVGRVVARGRHVFTHRVWDMRAHEVVVSGGSRGDWRRPDDVALGTAHRTLLARAGEGAHRARGR
jgi:adenine-specific DNA glycosylase